MFFLVRFDSMVCSSMGPGSTHLRCQIREDPPDPPNPRSTKDTTVSNLVRQLPPQRPQPQLFRSWS